MNRSQLAINSISTRGPMEETLAGYAAAGFRNVEFYLGHVKEYLAQGYSLSDFRRLLDGHQLRFIGGFETQLEGFSAGEARAANHKQVVENAKLIAELGGTALVVGTDGPAGATEDPLGLL
nr:sugar phosphate isomerase/epimerase [Armatimonadota bacterium]